MYLGQGDIARLLIREGAFLDHRDIYGNTVAHGLFVRGVYTAIGQENINSLLKILVCVGFSDFGQVNHMEASVLSLAIRGYTHLVRGHTNDQSFRNTYPTSNPSASLSRLDLAPSCSIYEPSIDSDQAASITTTRRRKNAAGQTPRLHSIGVSQADPCLRLLQHPENDISTPPTVAAKFKVSRLDIEKPWLRSESTLSNEPYQSSNNITLQNFAESITVLLRNGAEPWTAIPVPLWFRSVEWWYGQQGYLRYEERIRDCPAMAAIYYHVIHSLYPETLVSTEGDIFWDARQDVEGPAYGTSFLLPLRETRAD
ncbi:hypothetical protein G7Y79_00053g088130 [Physcia stellaris]|nr:hypothetical protein G7Y79_00053g088130 [Physcia stellaris]